MTVYGVDRALSWFQVRPGQVRRGAAKGLYNFGLKVMAASQQIVPVGGPPTSPYDISPGTLRASGTVSFPDVTGSTVSVTLGYGGAASDYARRQHEDLTYNHKPGQQAKYLEEPLLRMEPEALGIIIDAIQEESHGSRG